MPKCEICGEREAVKKVMIEGAALWVCDRCGGGLKPLPKRKSALPSLEEEEIVEDYAERIKEALRSKGWSVEELAKAINEKRSYLERVLAGSTLPNDSLVKKLEKLFGLKLRQKRVKEEGGERRVDQASLGEFFEDKTLP